MVAIVQVPFFELQWNHFTCGETGDGCEDKPITLASMLAISNEVVVVLF